jgi:hypothetical protein
MDFATVAREIVQWAETPTGALVVYPTVALAGLAVGYCGHRLKKWYDKNCCEPDRKPFEGIHTQKLPKSELKV